MTIRCIRLYHVDLPLITPYALSYRTFESFEPFLVQIELDDGRSAWGEQHISPGSSSETRDHGWDFLTAQAKGCLGISVESAYQHLLGERPASPVAAAAMLNALDQLTGSARCQHDETIRIPVLSAFSADTKSAIASELDRKLALGYRTFKIKVGKSVDADRERVATIQAVLGSRGRIRVDANRAYSVDDAIRFADVLDPAICELFEQPCDAADWDGNGRVAIESPVPLMLDEPICTLMDIERAATMEGVGFCKLKLKRFGSIATLETAIETAHALGLDVVLGDGLGSDINCYLEALVSARHLNRAGEFNGCLKIQDQARITEIPLGFDQGHMIIPTDFQPRPNPDRLKTYTRRFEQFAHTGDL